MPPSTRPQWTLEQLRRENPDGYSVLQKFVWACMRTWPEAARVNGLEAAQEIFEQLIEKGWLRAAVTDGGRIVAQMWDDETDQYIIVG